MVGGEREREGSRFTVGNVGTPDDALLACPRCFFVAVPRRVEGTVIECVNCRARLQCTGPAESRGSNAESDQRVSGLRAKARDLRERGPVPSVQASSSKGRRIGTRTGKRKTDQAVRKVRGADQPAGAGSALPGTPKGTTKGKAAEVRSVRSTSERDEQGALQGVLFGGGTEPG